MAVGDLLRKFDAYPKVFEDISVKTVEGACLTLFATITMVFLLTAEIGNFLKPVISEDLFVDTTRGHKLRINLDIYIPSISCDYLSLDAMDSAGEQHLHIEHNIFKTRMNLDGHPIEEPKKEDIQATTKKLQIPVVNATVEKIEEPKVLCGSCYGAEANSTHCCNVCSDVIDAYREKKWNPKTDDFEQCKNERKFENEKEKHALEEGCRIAGYLEVNRMGGSFHIAPGKSFSINHIHVHDVQPYSSSKFNTSHRINHLSFGTQFNFGDTHPLDSLDVNTKEGAVMFQYFIKIVPTMFVPQSGETLHTNQFSVTTHQRSASGSNAEAGGMPGVFFSYELSPLMVKFTEKSNSYGHLATNICAIIGGIFTVAGILDSILHNGLRAIKKKIELGKFN